MKNKNKGGSMKRQFGDVRIPGSRTIMAGISSSPWGWLIMLVILVIFGVVIWWTLKSYHLVTAFIFFLGGLILAWFGSNIIPEDERSEHAFKLILIPIVLGIVGYFLEYLNIWRVPYSIEFSLFGLIAEPITITLDSILLMVIAVLILVQIVLSLKKS
jgi:hypothetical protein